MSKYVPALVVGFLVAAGVAFLLTMLSAAGGADAGPAPTLVGALGGVFTAYLMANLAGNRRSAKGSDAQKQAVLDLRTDPGQALLIVFREGFLGSAAGMDVSVDGRFVAQLKSPRFTATSVAPGARRLSMGFGGLAATQNEATVMEFAAAPGEVAAFRATMKMGGVKNRIVLQRVDDDREALVKRLRPMTMIAPDGGAGPVPA